VHDHVAPGKKPQALLSQRRVRGKGGSFLKKQGKASKSSRGWLVAETQKDVSGIKTAYQRLEYLWGTWKRKEKRHCLLLSSTAKRIENLVRSMEKLRSRGMQKKKEVKPIRKNLNWTKACKENDGFRFLPKNLVWKLPPREERLQGIEATFKKKKNQRREKRAEQKN